MQPIYEISCLNFNYESKKILKNISFSILPQKITALIGPNGVGKTTLLRILSKVHHNYSGSILFKGIENEA